MRKTLLATTALAAAGAFAAGPVLAADMLSVGVGGYMEQWFGGTSVDATDAKGASTNINDGAAQQSDSEIHFKGKLEADNGLTFSIKVELEGNNSTDATGDQWGTAIDESQLTVSGEFGQLVLGAEDSASVLTHHNVRSAGAVGLNCGDVGNWVPGMSGCGGGLETSGHQFGDRNQISYFSPRVSGVQFGASYIPDSTQENSSRSGGANNDRDAWSAGGNYVGEFGGANVSFSVGHYQRSQFVTAANALKVFDGREGANATTHPARNKAWYDAHQANITNIPMVLNGDKVAQSADGDTTKPGIQADTGAGSANTVLIYNSDGTLDGNPDITTLSARRNASSQAINTQTSSVMQADDYTHTNIGLRVGMGSFSFDVAYAAVDGGAFKKESRTHLGTDTAATATSDDSHYEVVVKDASKDYDVISAGGMFVDGPMSVSLGFIMADYDNGDEQTLGELGAGYTLAPGVVWKSSVFMAEKNTNDGKEEREATGFVTGIALSF